MAEEHRRGWEKRGNEEVEKNLSIISLDCDLCAVCMHAGWRWVDKAEKAVREPFAHFFVMILQTCKCVC